MCKRESIHIQIEMLILSIETHLCSLITSKQCVGAQDSIAGCILTSTANRGKKQQNKTNTHIKTKKNAFHIYSNSCVTKKVIRNPEKNEIVIHRCHSLHKRESECAALDWLKRKSH